jgi:hypothetical protein
VCAADSGILTKSYDVCKSSTEMIFKQFASQAHSATSTATAVRNAFHIVREISGGLNAKQKTQGADFHHLTLQVGGHENL